MALIDQTQLDEYFANLVEKHRLVTEASDKIIEAHALYHKALIEEYIAEKELKAMRRKLSL